jgi:O-antigen ligase
MGVDRFRSAVAPLYLLACLVLGGSAQGVWQNAILQLGGLALIALAAAHSNAAPLPSFAKQVLLIAIAALALVVLQSILLPSSIWSDLGPRRQIAAGYRLLGMSVPAEPLSLTPYEGLGSIFACIPALAIFCSIVRLRLYRSEWLAFAVVAAAIGGIALGSLQVASPSSASPWYLYPETNFGSAVGFFANANHMGTLLVISFPFLAALSAASTTSSDRERRSSMGAAAAGAALLLIVGLALNGSLAAYGLALPVLVASALILFRTDRRMRRWASLAVVLLMIGSVVALEVAPLGTNLITQEATTSVQSRQEIFSTTLNAARDFFPFGSGLGSFRNVYHLYEDPNQVTSTYVVHAHNDYLEIALEMGIAGIFLIVVFLVCWGAAVWRVWRATEGEPFARAASIASAAILIHSLVDFPLRTAAISATFAMCLALLADGGIPKRSSPDDLRPTRHVRIG